MPVYWLIAAGQRLRAAAFADADRRLDNWSELQRRFDAVLAAVFPGRVVLVRDQFSGYRPFDGLAVLMVEVQAGPGGSDQGGPFPAPATYIVKVAIGDKTSALTAELAAWDAARPPHLRGDGVFVSLDPHPPRGSGPPAALVYGDATAVLGERNVVPLEDAVLRACRFGSPRPASVVRLLGALYDRLETHFYSRSYPSPPASYLADGSRPRLADVLLRWRDPSAPGRHDPFAGVSPPTNADPADPDRRQLRRETLAILAADPDGYADPVDYLTGVYEAGGPAPTVLRGFSHGDLHARNVQVAVVDDDATSCAVFDYESMRPDNFLAWDFIKMEVEIGVRLLDLAGEPDRAAFTRQAATVWRSVAARSAYHDHHDAAGPDPPDGRGVVPSEPWLAERAAALPDPLRRLTDVLAAVRRLAHKHLGANRGRGYDWLAGYDFLLAWYAARAGLYPNYTERMTVAVLAAAGVSARRRMPARPSPAADRAAGEQGYRPRFLHARARVRGGDPSARADGVARLGDLRRDYPHVLEIEEELALGHIDRGDYAAAEDVLQDVADRYRHTTAETPARLGALWKRRAVAASPADAAALRQSLEWYRRAEAAGGGYFAGVNVASVLMLLGEPAAARDQAARVRARLDRADPAADPFWPHATRGEVELLLDGDPAAALTHYRRAAGDPLCTPRDRASMRRQLELIRPHLGAAARAALTADALDQVFPPAPERP